MARYLSNEIEIVDHVIEKIGKNIVLGIPLAAGKANHIVNAFYQKARRDPSVQLTICTALTLQKPSGSSELEKRFLDPFVERVFGDYPDLDYELDRVQKKLPDNIKVIEFYFPPGKYLNNDEAQQDYVSSNYTHVVRDMIDRKVNVIAQIVSKREDQDGTKYSLSCNPDVTIDLIQDLRAQDAPLVAVAQVNQNLPFMLGDAVVEESFFDVVMDDPKKYFQVFGPPKMKISAEDYMIGLYCSALVRDDGELQLGIGSLGDSTVYHLLLRHQQNREYQNVLRDLKVHEKFGSEIHEIGGTEPFSHGLFGASEMLVDGFMHLYEAGIVKKKAFDDVRLQTLINKGLIAENFDETILDVLLAHKVIHSLLSEADFEYLQYWGILTPDLTYHEDHIITPDGERIGINLLKDPNLRRLKEIGLGDSLKNGQVMQGGFFLGPQSFYTWLRNLPEKDRQLINMQSVRQINQLYGHEDLDRLHRKNARFINSCMKHTLLGAAVSDGLENGQVVSGVGGQYNFVAMAQELPDGHSILNLRSTRTEHGKPLSNIVPSYGHTTIPRHLRDIVVTEYGIAYIRGCTDSEIIQKLIKISDSRFQDHMIKWAKKSGKLPGDYVLPAEYKNNYPSSYLPIIEKYKKLGLYPDYPFGTDLTDEEIILGKALKSLKSDLSVPVKLVLGLIRGIFLKPSTTEQSLLKRMQLSNPKNIKDFVYQKLLLTKLRGELD